MLAVGPTSDSTQQANVFLRNDTVSADNPIFSVINKPGDPSRHLDHSYDVAFVDVDGTLTLIVANRTINGSASSGGNRVYTSNGDGSFTENATHPIALASPDFSSAVTSTYGLAIGNLDNDTTGGNALDEVITANRLTVSSGEGNLQALQGVRLLDDCPVAGERREVLPGCAGHGGEWQPERCGQRFSRSSGWHVSGFGRRHLHRFSVHHQRHQADQQRGVGHDPGHLIRAALLSGYGSAM